MLTREILVNIVGPANVTSEPSVMEEYSRDFSFVNPVTPDWVVKPQNSGQIQELVKAANETFTPLVAVSSGPPHFRGDSVPAAGGAVIVDLSKMKKIIRVDRYHRVAMVEPGVTFAELIPALEKEGIRLNLPLLPKKSKSVVASLLEREPVIMPKYQWDISDPLACLQVCFGTGDEFRTGQAAGPGSIEEQWKAGGVQKAPYGPGVIAWHRFIQGAQGTMGIVSWASLRCELLPEMEEPFVIGSSTPEKLLEIVHWLVRRRLVNECFILNRTNLAAILARKWPGDFRDIKNSLPPWILFYNLAGYEYFPAERVAFQKKDILDIAQKLGLKPQKSAGGISAQKILKTVQQPCPEPYWKLRVAGACQDVFFLTINDRLADLIEVMNRLSDQHGYPCSEMGVYIQPSVQGTHCHCEFDLFYDPSEPAERNRVRELSNQAVTELSAAGAFFSRPYGESARQIMNRDAAAVSALQKIKNILDPNNVLNPGKLCF
ncbi:MAG TPA: FAD-binding oxidoreductase [Dehalococcoidales bacterium]|nr:FAD-binding oxidoreductase [Dehalococcoidales bacterium]